MYIYQTIKQKCGKQGNLVALNIQKKAYTYNDLLGMVNKTISYYSSIGIKAGDRVIFLSRNNPELLYAYIAASKIGFTIVFLSNLDEAVTHEVNKLIKEAVPDFCIVDKYHWKKIHELKIENSKIFPLNGLYISELNKNKINNEIINENVIFVQAYTSGTTGQPKGVCFTEETLCRRAHEIANEMLIDKYSRILLTGYLFNMTGLPLSVAVFLKGAALHFKDNENIFEQIQEQKITHFMLPPLALIKAINKKEYENKDLSSIRLIAYGGAHMPQNTIDQAKKNISCKWLQGYGLTESCGPITWLRDEDHNNYPGSVGFPAPGIKIKVISESGKKVGPNKIGEIIIEGDSLMMGYWDSTRMIADSSSVQNKSFRTGDLGYLNKDGYLYLKGRRKECIAIADGNLIYVREIEDIIQEYKGVEENAVIGLHTSEGEKPVAIIKSSCSIDYLKLKKYLTSKLSLSKLPHYFVSIDQYLPRNKNQKVMKHQLHKLVNKWLQNNKVTSFSEIS